MVQSDFVCQYAPYANLETSTYLWRRHFVAAFKPAPKPTIKNLN